MTARGPSTSQSGRDTATDGMFARAKAFATAGDLDKAIALYRQLLVGESGNAELRRELARALQRTGAVDEAITCYRDAIALDPGDARAHDELGRMLSARGDVRAASSASFCSGTAGPRRRSPSFARRWRSMPPIGACTIVSASRWRASDRSSSTRRQAASGA